MVHRKQAKKQHMERTLSTASAGGDEATPTAAPTGGDGVGGGGDGSVAKSTHKTSLSVQEAIRPRSSAVVGRVTEEEADFTNFREPLLDDN